MIQELLGGGIGVRAMSGIPGQDEEKKISVVMSGIGGLTAVEGSSNSSSSPASDQQHQNLRCPRCESSNTKFCYYNNYNLTQPRHFCKACRRYWTKGGALRNVPIGGGCRKTKTPTISSAAGRSTPAKTRSAPIFTSDVGQLNMVSGVIDHQIHHHNEQIAPHNSQLMALLRAAENPSYNSNHILNSVVIKDQVGMLESNLLTDASRNPLMGLCSSIWRSNSDQHHEQQQQLILPQLSLQQNFLFGQVSNIGFQDLRQRLSANYAGTTQSSSNIINMNLATDSSLTSTTNEAAAVAVQGELIGNWTSTLQWTDLSTSNGSIP